jgi:transcriptional regulator with XRE-family HTH domain
MSITSAQVKEARKALGWTRSELAVAARVSLTTVHNAEQSASRLSEWALTAIRTALKSAGVEFIAENGGGAGVRLRKAK